MTCEESQRLIQILKKIIGSNSFAIPTPGSKAELELSSVFSANDRFTVFFNRSGRARPEKYTLLLRYGKDQGLLRIDVNGTKHVNPDGTVVDCTHIHKQTHEEGKWDAWAYELPVVFGNADDRIDTLKQFLEYCNVNNISSIEISEQTQMG